MTEHEVLEEVRKLASGRHFYLSKKYDCYSTGDEVTECCIYISGNPICCAPTLDQALNLLREEFYHDYKK